MICSNVKRLFFLIAKTYAFITDTTLLFNMTYQVIKFVFDFKKFKEMLMLKYNYYMVPYFVLNEVLGCVQLRITYFNSNTLYLRYRWEGKLHD